MPCDRVPGEPPRNLHEALQSFYFFHMVQATISSRAVGFAQRFDTLFYPFYAKDLEAGNITREQDSAGVWWYHQDLNARYFDTDEITPDAA